jgi:phytol kinase
MSTQFIYCLILGGSFLALFALGELLYHVAKIQAEYTRKLIHVGTGLLTLFFPVFEDHWYVLLLCSLFAVILTLSKKFNFLKSINAIDRKSHGSISYPLAVYATFLFYRYGYIDHWSGNYERQIAFYYIPILTLAICDPLAALLGKRFPIRSYTVGEGKKSFGGSFAFFISAALICFIMLYGGLAGTHPLFSALIISVVIAATTTLAEAVSRNGFDNLTIPGTAMLVLYLLSHFTDLYHNINR